jgi:thymidylate synthase
VKILVLEQGVYGRRIADHIRNKKPAWDVSTFYVPPISEPVVDEPEMYLPDDLPSVDLILHLGESPQAAQLLPLVAKLSGAKAVIASIDSSAWIPLGLRNQLRREMEKEGVTVVYPEPLCSIDEDTVGYGETVQPYTNEVIRSFSRSFGKPILDVELDTWGRIVKADVLRGSPCGSTQYTVGRVMNMSADKAVPASGLMCLHYPCLASMKFEQTEKGVDTIMHNSGRIFNDGMAKALKKATE